MKRKQECRRKYGNACPHMERHSKQWTKPAAGVLPEATAPRPGRHESAPSGQ